MTNLLRYLIICLAMAVPFYDSEATAQRRITPVQPQREIKKKETTDKKPDMTHVAEKKDAQGNIILVDTLSGVEFIDSTALAMKPKNIYPLFHSITLGVNIWDPIMRAIGQKYGGGDLWAELSLHNRFNPIIGFGMGMADMTPDGQNYTYKSSAAPYFFIGMNYNVFYNSNPNYQLLVGLRYGFSSFSYEITNATMDSGYWDDPVSFNIPSQNATAGYFEFGLGIKVLVVKPISLGWTIKFHSLLHEGTHKYGEPMYIPGFGKRNSSLTGAFSIMYTIPVNKPKPVSVDTEPGVTPGS